MKTEAKSRSIRKVHKIDFNQDLCQTEETHGNHKNSVIPLISFKTRNSIDNQPSKINDNNYDFTTATAASANQ